MRVLFVDDYENTAVICRELLQLLGHDCRCAFSGEDALELLHSFAPDVIVLDLNMPGCSGYEVARRVRASELGAHVFLAAITGTDADEYLAKAAGFDLQVEKPASAEKLILITNAAASRRAHA